MPSNAVLQETHGTKTIYIVPDQDPLNPRTDYDHPSTMVCSHKRYNLGDEQVDDPLHWLNELNQEYNPDAEDFTDLEAAIENLDNLPIIVLPLYLYDHSGITMNTTGFHCPWDSGQVGFIYIDISKAKSEWPFKGGEAYNAWRKRVEGYLRGEVAEYDAYISGQVYGFVIEEDDEEIDACWGFYGYRDVLNAAREAVGVETETE